MSIRVHCDAFMGPNVVFVSRGSTDKGRVPRTPGTVEPEEKRLVVVGAVVIGSR